MQRYILIRVGQGLVATLGLLLVTFLLVRTTGDPTSVLLPLHASPADRAALTSQLALDQPVWQQFATYIGNAATGDFGESYTHPGQETMSIILNRLPATGELAIGSLIVGVLLGVPTAVAATIWQHTWVRTACEWFALIGQSAAIFWLGLVLMRIFAIDLGILPVAGREGPSSLVLPSLTLGLLVASGVFRVLRSSLTEVLAQDHIVFLRARGVPYVSHIVLRHGLRGAMVPSLTFTATIFGSLLAGSVVVESVFVWPGVGLAVVDGLASRDFPLVQAAIVLFGTITILVNLLADLASAYLDPRVRLGRAEAAEQ